MAKKETKSKLHETKAGLASKNSGHKTTETAGAKNTANKKADLENLPKTSKENVGKSGSGEGLH